MIIARTRVSSLLQGHARRLASTTTAKDKFKVVVVGAGEILAFSTNPHPLRTSSTGSGGLAVANQIYWRFKDAGKSLNPGDIVVLDAAQYHYYQVLDSIISATYMY